MPNFRTVQYNVGDDRFLVRCKPRGWRGIVVVLRWILGRIPYITGSEIGIDIEVKGIDEPKELTDLSILCEIAAPGESRNPIGVPHDITSLPFKVSIPSQYLSASGEYRFDITFRQLKPSHPRQPVCDFSVLSKDLVTWTVSLSALTLIGVGVVTYVVNQLS